MRDYGVVQVTFWTSPTTHDLPDDAKMLALYLLTGPHSNALGCFKVGDGYVMDDLTWVSERVVKGFKELSDKGWANRCETTKWVLINNYLKFNPPQNPNQVTALKRLASQIPENFAYKSMLSAALTEHCGRFEQGELFNPSETVSKPSRNGLGNQNQNQDHEQESQNHHACGALKTWIAVKQSLKNELPAAEWGLWVRPGFLLKVLSGSVMLIALPPSGKIVEAAKARKEMLATRIKEAGFGGVAFTRYPDRYEMQRLQKEFPDLYKQFSPAVKKKVRA